MKHTLTIAKGQQTITFNSLPSRIIEDSEFELTATSSAGLPLSYSTPDDNIAISGNKVTILGPGLATIIASQDGNANYHPAGRVEQNICINPSKPVITDEKISVTSIELTSSNDIGNQWFLNGNEIAGATEKNLTITVDGAYTVRSKVEACVSMMSDEYVSIVTGAEDLESGISIYPNPVSRNLVVEVANEVNFSLDIIDTSGRTLFNRKNTNSSAVFDVGHLREGVYFIRLKVNDKLYFKQIVKKGTP
jgi:Secretion system C-terminal sorting domain